MIWGTVLRIVAAIAGFFVNIGRALGRKEYEHDAFDEYNERVAKANAARNDADEPDGLHDPRNRDNRN